MAILIPSKKIYNISNSIVNKNVISSVEYELADFNVISKDQSIYMETREAEGAFPDLLDDAFGATSPISLSNYKVERNTFSGGGVYYISVAGIYPIFKDIEISVKKQLTNLSYVDINNPITVSFDKIVTVRERALAIRVNTASTAGIDATIERDYEGQNSHYYSLNAPHTEIMAALPYKVSTSNVDENYEWSRVDITLEDYFKDNYNYVFEHEAKIEANETADNITASFKVLCGVAIFAWSAKFNENEDRAGLTKLIEYRPQKININIFGKTYELLTENETLTESINAKKGEKVSITNNILIQDKEKAISQANKILTNYYNGKETATIRCSIGKYFDENGNNVISTKTDTRMIFRHYDKVVPMVRKAHGTDEPLSLTADGKAKVFEVVGISLFYDGAVWQELTLKESGSIELAHTFYTTSVNNGGGLTYDITSSKIVVEENSAGGKTYIIGA